MRKAEYLESNINEKSQIIKRLGIWGFVFFAVKGVIWLVLGASLFHLGGN